MDNQQPRIYLIYQGSTTSSFERRGISDDTSKR
nr:MAG TPA: hypothetical protein [Caudoviricetes sp.]